MAFRLARPVRVGSCIGRTCMCRYRSEAFSRPVWILRSLTRHRWHITVALLTITVSPLRCPSRDLALLHIIVSRSKQRGRMIRCLQHEARDPPRLPIERIEQVQSGGYSAQTDMYICTTCRSRGTAVRNIKYKTPVKCLAWRMWIKLQKRFSLEGVLVQSCPFIELPLLSISENSRPHFSARLLTNGIHQHHRISGQ